MGDISLHTIASHCSTRDGNGTEVMNLDWPKGVLEDLKVFFFLKIDYLFIYSPYMSTLQLSSDTPEKGVRSHYGWL